MAAHEAPAAVHDHIAAADVHFRASVLARQFENAARARTDPQCRPMTSREWNAWIGQAYAVLAEVARG